MKSDGSSLRAVHVYHSIAHRTEPFFFFSCAFPFPYVLFRSLALPLALSFFLSFVFFRLPPLRLWQRVSSLAPLQEKGVDAGVPPEAGRSAWNEAGTWEEVEKTDWCKGKITEALRCVSRTVWFLRWLPPFAGGLC